MYLLLCENEMQVSTVVITWWLQHDQILSLFEVRLKHTHTYLFSTSWLLASSSKLLANMELEMYFYFLYSMLISCTEQLCISQDKLIFIDQCGLRWRLHWTCVKNVYRKYTDKTFFTRYRWVPLPKRSVADVLSNWISTAVAVPQ